MALLMALADDGLTPITTLNKEVFVSAKMIGNNKIEIVLRQNPPPYRGHELYTYTLSVEVNEHLLQTLNW